MRVDLTGLDDFLRRFVEQVGRLADKENVRAYLVGGAVRDLILKRKVRDIDIVVEGNAVDFARNVAVKEPGGKVLAHERFGTAVIDFQDGRWVDFVTARSENYPRPGALPAVRRGTIKDDLFRRDFTVNAIAARLDREALGEIVDEYGGIADLRAGVLRVLHDNSFVDDPTRILRAARYEARFGLTIEHRTARALRAAVRNDCFATLTPVRYFHEFKRTLEEERPSLALARLKGWRAIRYVKFDRRSSTLIRQAENLPRRLDIKLSWWLLFFMVLCERVDRNRIGDTLVSLNLPRDLRQKILGALQFETVLDMLSKNCALVDLKNYGVEQKLFFLLQSKTKRAAAVLGHNLREEGVL